MRQVYVKEYGITPGNDRALLWKVRMMLDELQGTMGIEFVFESGTYHFYPDYAVEKTLYISNHDEDVPKRIAFDFSGWRKVKIRGEGAVFLFHTDILPFHLDRCHEILIEGITIDYERTGYSEGEIVELSGKRMVLRIDRKEYPYRVFHGELYFEEEGAYHPLYYGCLEMDRRRNAPVYQGRDISFNRPYPSSYGAVFREAGENLVEVTLTEDQQFPETSREGNRMILRHHLRTHPCFYITGSEGITLRDITIYHCTGMAVISQFTKDITIERVCLVRHPQKDRIFTATADGFHFVYAGGKIHIKNCVLENQLDDPVNIHGIYGRIHKVTSKREVIVELVEGMQKGVLLGTAGDYFAVIDNRTMLEQEHAVITEITWMNSDYQRIVFAEDMENLTPGFVVEHQSWVPDVLIEGCTFRNNRARGLLLTSAGDVLVRDNTFETPGAAILIEGDSNYWFESGATRHIVIEGNRFHHCAYVSAWGKAPIQVSPSALVWEKDRRYHQYLEVRGNVFQCCDDRLVNAVNLKKLVFLDNKIERTTVFEPIKGQALELDGVLEVETDINKEQQI